MQRRDHLATQGLPPPHHHVDGALAVEEGLERLLLVLIDEVHVVDPQQPVIDPEEGHGQCPRRPRDQRAVPPLLSEGRVPGSRDPTHTLRKTSPLGRSNGSTHNAGPALPGFKSWLYH